MLLQMVSHCELRLQLTGSLQALQAPMQRQLQQKQAWQRAAAAACPCHDRQCCAL